MIKRIIFALYAYSLLCPVQAFAEAGTIGHLFEGRSPVKAYVGAIVNESGQRQMSPDVFKKILENSLNSRKAMDFDTVASPAESDIQITASIKKYQYLERGPFKPSPGIGTMLADAAATASLNYVEMEVMYTITDTRTGKVLWTDDVNKYIKEMMTPEESIPLISDKVARAFITQCFGSSHKDETVKQLM
jgi:hypothetical protein